MSTFVPVFSVPPIDSPLNTHTGYVVGNKSDTVAGDSLVSLSKQVLARLVLPSLNSSDNVTPADVLGLKGDASYNGGDSVYARLHTIEDHNHSVQLVAPHLGAAVTVTGGAGAWAFGVQSNDIIASGAVASPFDIHGITISTIGAADLYQIRLIANNGGGDTVIGDQDFERIGAPTISEYIEFQTPVLAAGTRVRAQVASASGGGDTCTIKVRYHVYG